MIPSAVVQLAELPLTPNGKIDRNALPDPETQLTGYALYEEPKTENERLLCDVWQSELGIEKVGVTDNFFSIGGDSILSIRVIAACNRRGIGLATRQLFEHQTIRELAKQIGTQSTVIAPQEAIEGQQVLLPAQRWFLENGDNIDRSHYNQSLLLTVPAEFNVGQLVSLISAIYERHDALRLRFAQSSENTEPANWQAQYVPLETALIEASVSMEHVVANNEEQFLQALAEKGEGIQASLSIEDGPLMRAMLFSSEHFGSRLLLVLHHLVVDGISWRSLLTDLNQGYSQLISGEHVSLSEKTSSLQQWGEFLSQYAQTEEIKQECEYWLEQLSIPVAPLAPGNQEVIDNTVATTSHVSFTLDTDQTTALLTDSNKAYRTEINDLLLAALLFGIGQWTGESAIRIDMEGHGREAMDATIDHSDTLGWFTSIYPLTLHCESTADIAQLIIAVKEQIRQVPKKALVMDY